MATLMMRRERGGRERETTGTSLFALIKEDVEAVALHTH